MQQCADSKPEQDDAGHRSDRIRNRLRDDNAPDRGWQQLGQEEDQRDQQDQLAQRGNEDRDFRLPQRDKRLLKRDLEPKDQDTAVRPINSGLLVNIRTGMVGKKTVSVQTTPENRTQKKVLYRIAERTRSWSPEP